MSFIDKLSMVLSDSLDYLIDKNRQRAQLNRITAVINNETEILNRAYAALGRHYYKKLDGKTEETDVSQICETIKSARLRLKKAKARYEYILKYGVPTPGLRDDIAVAYLDSDEDEPVQNKTESSCKITADIPCQEDEQDITIAVQNGSVEEKIENAAQAGKNTSVEAKIEAAAENLSNS